MQLSILVAVIALARVHAFTVTLTDGTGSSLSGGEVLDRDDQRAGAPAVSSPSPTPANTSTTVHLNNSLQYVAFAVNFLNLFPGPIFICSAVPHYSNGDIDVFLLALFLLAPP